MTRIIGELMGGLSDAADKALTVALAVSILIYIALDKPFEMLRMAATDRSRGAQPE